MERDTGELSSLLHFGGEWYGPQSSRARGQGSRDKAQSWVIWAHRNWMIPCKRVVKGLEPPRWSQSPTENQGLGLQSPPPTPGPSSRRDLDP